MLGSGLPGDATRGVVREVRRKSDPVRAHHLWDAIKAVRLQKQIPAIPRMGRYMKRYHGVVTAATQKLLDLAVDDNLVKLEKKMGSKGTKNGVEEKAYRLPTNDMLPMERHDWYCFYCSTGGEVILCGGCHRVFHEICLKNPPQGSTAAIATSAADPIVFGSGADEFLCDFCRLFQTIQTAGLETTLNKKDRKDLNHLLEVLCRKLKAKMPMDLLFREAPEIAAQKSFMESSMNNDSGSESQPTPPAPTPPATTTTGTPTTATTPSQQPVIKNPRNINKNDETSDTWRVNFLIKHRMDFEEIAKKCSSNEYRIVEEFKADCQLLVHNVAIFHGAQSSMADQARQMLRDCTIDLKDMALCRDCFRWANERQEKYWFCRPCRPLHELVYAKQPDRYFWPAKVIRMLDSGASYDVRFFGSYHQKALINKKDVRPISTNTSSLEVKVTSQWNKACEELRKHQTWCAKVQAQPEFFNEPFGDPFTEEDVAECLGGVSESEESDVEEAGGVEATAMTSHSDPSVVQQPAPETKVPSGEKVSQEEAAPPDAKQVPQVLPALQPPKRLFVAVKSDPSVLANSGPPQHNQRRQPQTKKVPVPVPEVVAPVEEPPPKKKRGRPKKLRTEGEATKGGQTMQSSQPPPPVNTADQHPAALQSSTTTSAPTSAPPQQPLLVAASTATTEENLVSSSSPNFQEPPESVSVAVQTPSKFLRHLVNEAAQSSSHAQAIAAQAKKAAEKEFNQYIEKMRADFDQEKKRAVNVATRSLERDLERLKADHATEMEEMTEKHSQEMSDIKKKQWCFNCEAEAIYWCCWNTAYCTIECQLEHWHREHKRACRRKR